MALHSTLCEMGNVGVVNFGFYADIIGQMTESRAQNDACMGLKRRAAANKGNRFLNLLIESAHSGNI